METFEPRFKRLSEKQSPINTNPLEEGFRSFHLKADGLNLELLNKTKKIPVVLPSSPIKFKANC